MRLFTVYFDHEYFYQVEADKLEFEWATKTAVFVTSDGEVVGAAADWEAIISEEVE